ncbi:MAG: tetratricopeptide repeat protein [Polyangiaceae bacterium]|nr:tetratricopeptide repeat protein [Polyangiaceae bacterium]
MKRIAVALAFALAVAAPSSAGADEPAESWATARARSLTDQATANREAGRHDQALSRYREAIEMDGSYGPAYLGLASLREAMGEIDEAKTVLALALEAIPGFGEALLAQADLLNRAKRYDESTASLLEALKLDRDSVTVLERLLRVAPKGGNLPVALGAARRLAALARARGDEAAAKEADLTARALTRLVADADPVLRGRKHGEQARRALATVADPRPSKKR